MLPARCWRRRCGLRRLGRYTTGSPAPLYGSGRVPARGMPRFHAPREMPASAPSPTTLETAWPTARPARATVATIAEVFCRPLPYSARGGTQIAPAQQACQVASVDADRAGGGTESATGAGVEAVIDKIGFDIGSIFAGRGTARQFAPTDDALARRKGEPMRRAHAIRRSRIRYSGRRSPQPPAWA